MTKIIFILLLLFSCKNNRALPTEKSIYTNLAERKGFTQDSIEISKLPYSFRYNYENPTIEGLSIEGFFEKNKNNVANGLFSASTNLPKNTLQKIEFQPYRGNGLFVKRFPNFEKNRILLFVYEHSDLNYFLPIFELQILDQKNEVIDKLIVAGGREYECGWDRYFQIQEDFTVSIHNLEYCFDIEDEIEVFRNEDSTKYKITLNGFEKLQ